MYPLPGYGNNRIDILGLGLWFLVVLKDNTAVLDLEGLVLGGCLVYDTSVLRELSFLQLETILSLIGL